MIFKRDFLDHELSSRRQSNTQSHDLSIPERNTLPQPLALISAYSCTESSQSSTRTVRITVSNLLSAIIHTHPGGEILVIQHVYARATTVRVVQ